MSKETFEKRLKDLINEESMENGSNTPDFILAKYISNCLEAFNRAVNARTNWYGDDTEKCEPPVDASSGVYSSTGSDVKIVEIK